MLHVASCLTHRGCLGEAQEWLQNSIAVSNEIYGAGHSQTLRATSMLDEVLRAQRDQAHGGSAPDQWLSAFYRGDAMGM